MGELHNDDNIFQAIENGLLTNLDDAIKFMTPEGISLNDSKSLLQSMFSDDEIIDRANSSYMYCQFENFYKNYLITILMLCGENASLLNFEVTVLALARMLNAKPINVSFKDFAKESSMYYYLHIKNIKNDRLWDYLSKYYTGVTRYISEKTRSVYIKLLPAVSPKNLNNLIKAISTYY